MDDSANINKVRCLSSNEKEHNKNKSNPKLFDGELVLRDVIYYIFENFGITDLCRVAQVCKSWNHEAKREIDRRYNLEYRVLPVLGSEELESFYVAKNMQHKPHVTLLFPGSNRKLEDRDDFDLEYKVFKTYRKHFPNKLITFGVFETILDEDLINSFPLKTDKEENEQHGILSLSLPSNKRLTIKESYVTEENFLSDHDEKIENFLTDLVPDDPNSKSTLIILLANPDNLFSFKDAKFLKILKTIKAKFTENSYTLWGLVTPYTTYVSQDVNCSTIGETEARLIGLNLISSNLESWSIAIDICITKNEMMRRLNEFKESIKLKKNSLGFIAAPVLINEHAGLICYDDNYQLASCVKKIFPTVTFFGTFCEDEDFYFGIDSVVNDPNEDHLGHSNHEIISVMIISYE